MAFIAGCPFCGRRVQAPADAMGQSVACKKCHSYFTLAPLDDANDTAAAPGVLTGPEDRLSAPMGAVHPRPAAPLTAGAAASFNFDERPAPRHGRLNPLAVLALFLGGVGLGCASFPPLQWTSIGLAGAGCVAACLCVIWLPARTAGDAIILVGGALVSAGTLLTALVFPHWLGVESVLTRRGDTEPDPDRQVYRERADRRGAADEPAAHPLAAEHWVDAEQYDIEHGVVRVRIVEAHWRERPKAAAKMKELRKELHIKIELAHIGYRRQIVVRAFAAGAAPTLTDPTGKSYAFLRPAQTPGPRSLRPMMPLTETLSFEAPLTLPEWLRLELPASVFGGAGSLRFHIPRSIVMTSRAA